MTDINSLYYCRQCVCLIRCSSDRMMEQQHMAEEHPAYHGSWDNFEPLMNEFQERFWDAYGDRRW